MDHPTMEVLVVSGAGIESEDFFPAKDVQTCQAGSSLARCEGPLVGVLWGIDAQGTPLVRFDGAHGGKPLPARSVVVLDSGAVGREVVLLFEGGDPTRPLVMGVLRTPRPEPICSEFDGEKLVFSAEREIVLRCGDASITLTQAGKVLLQGAYVSSHASGVNRIKGGSVQIN